MNDAERAFFTPAPNALEWSRRPEFLGHEDAAEWTGSWQVMRDFFQLRCPRCNPVEIDDEGDHPRWVVVPGQGGAGDLWGKPVEEAYNEVLLCWDPHIEEDACPGCKATRSELVDAKELGKFNQLAVLAGMRSGKSVTGAIILTFIEHFILCMAHGPAEPGGLYSRGLHGWLDMSRAIQFEMTVLASTETQAKDTVWAIYTGFRDNSPWFTRYRTWMKRREAEQDTRHRRWRYSDDLVQEIRNEHPDVRLIIRSANSNSSGQAGRTRLAAVVDELGRMLTTDGPSGGEEVYRTQEASMLTARTEVQRLGLPIWLGAMISVSSPKSQDDAAYKLWKKSTTDTIEHMLSYRLATWEFNPRQPRSAFAAAFVKDPVGARTDFGASPPGTEHPLFEDPEILWRATRPRHRESATFEVYRDEGYMKARTVHMVYARDNHDRFVFGDAGERFDAFALACAHGEERMGPDGQPVWVTVYDWILRVIPEPNTEVYFQSALDILIEAAAKQGILRCRFDRWQSTKLIQDLRPHVPDSERHSLKTSEFVAFRGDLVLGRVELPMPEPEDFYMGRLGREWAKNGAHLSPAGAAIAELSGLQRDPLSGKVRNPHKGKRRGEASDDTAQVLVGAHHLVQTAGWTERFDDRSRRAARERAEAHVQISNARPRFLPGKTY